LKIGQINKLIFIIVININIVIVIVIVIVTGISRMNAGGNEPKFKKIKHSDVEMQQAYSSV
jgi:hypothetical protein